MLLTGGQSPWLRAPVGDTPAESGTSLHALWWPPTKIATQYLAPYLMGRDDAAYLRSDVPEARSVKRDLEVLGSRLKRP
jgi:hypothetical protein